MAKLAKGDFEERLDQGEVVDMLRTNKVRERPQWEATYAKSTLWVRIPSPPLNN